MDIHYHARPHLSVHSRSKSHSSVAGAAYRLGIKLFDERTKTWHDYRKRKIGEEIVRALTVAPAGAPAWATDPDVLWNAAESAERRRDSQVARDYRVPLAIGLDDEQAGALAESLARFIAEELHTSVSVAVHRDSEVDAFGVIKADGQRGMHAHLYFPTRPIAVGAPGSAPAFGAKLAAFRNKDTGVACIERLNKQWADLSNLISRQAGLATTFDHRSYKRMGVVREVEPKLGQTATSMERRGQQTQNGDQLRAHRQRRDGHSPAPQCPDISTDPSVGGVTAKLLPEAAEVAPHIRLPQPEAHVGPRLTPRVTVTVRKARALTQEDHLQSPLAWEPPSVVGLASRFEAAYTTWVTTTGRTVNPKLMTLVRGVEYALNALVTVAKALLHLDLEYKRFATTKLDMQWELEQKRAVRGDLRRENSTARHPYRPAMSAAHRRSLAAIQTLDEEIADRLRLSASIEEQMEANARRAQPWRHQATQERRRLKQRIAILAAEDPKEVERLVDVANASERPWLKLYSATKEPTLSLQKLVDAAEATEEDPREVDRTTQKAYRPPV